MTGRGRGAAERLEELDPASQRDLAKGLALLLEVLQQAVAGEVSPARAEQLFQRLALNALDADCAVLLRLMEDARTACLPPGSRRAVALLNALWRGRPALRPGQLAAMTVPEATELELVLAGRLLLRQGQLVQGLQAYRRAAAQPSASTATRDMVGAVEAFLSRRIERSRQPAAQRPLLGLCVAVRNEARHIAEWVAYHALVGVERFAIYENDSTDDTAAVLARLARHYDIEVVPWASQPANSTAYDHCLAQGGLGAQWLACLDADEFLIPGEADSLRDLLARVPAEVAALTPNWRIFGSSGHRARPALPSLAAYCSRAPFDFPANRHVKSIVRPELTCGVLNPHQFLTVGRQVDGGFAETHPLAGQLSLPRYTGLWINHYIVRSQEDFAAKRARGRPEVHEGPNRWVHDSYFADYDRNEVPDTSAQRFLPALTAALARLD